MTLEKDVFVNNFGTTGQIQLILVPLDQKLAELSNTKHQLFKKKRELFLGLFLANSPIREGRRFTFYKKNFGRPLHAYQKVVTVKQGKEG